MAAENMNAPEGRMGQEQALPRTATTDNDSNNNNNNKKLAETHKQASTSFSPPFREHFVAENVQLGESNEPRMPEEYSRGSKSDRVMRSKRPDSRSPKRSGGKPKLQRPKSERKNAATTLSPAFNTLLVDNSHLKPQKPSRKKKNKEKAGGEEEKERDAKWKFFKLPWSNKN